jgi:glycosyltransferase involved in cell wall biosynthesis
MQIGAIAELFDATTVFVPCSAPGNRGGEIPLEGPGLSVVPVPEPPGSDLPRKMAIPGWFIRHGRMLLREVARADAIHTPIPGDIGTLGMLAAYMIGKPLCVRYCGNWLVQRTVVERLTKRFMERVGGGRNVMFATGGAETPPSERNAAMRWIFSTTLRAEELKAAAARREPPSGGRARLITVSRLEIGKGIETVIESLPRVAQSIPGVHLDIVGNGRRREELMGLVARRGLVERVTFHGTVNHGTVLTLLQQADVFCFPSRSEGFPKVVLEALACGLPVITTRVSVLPHLLREGGGLLLDSVTPDGVATAVETALGDPARYLTMSRCAVTTARGYSLERWRDVIGDALTSAWGPLTARA